MSFLRLAHFLFNEEKSFFLLYMRVCVCVCVCVFLKTKEMFIYNLNHFLIILSKKKWKLHIHVYLYIERKRKGKIKRHLDFPLFHDRILICVFFLILVFNYYHSKIEHSLFEWFFFFLRYYLVVYIYIYMKH